MITYTPMYNEMPWTPFFLRHLLDFDCPIVISEGASEARYNDNDRSTDGTWELLQLFADRWKDRVTIYYHDYSLNTHGEDPRSWRRPRSRIKIKVWDNLDDGEWMVGLAPDNIYKRSDIPKIKSKINNAKDDDYLLMTGQRVFHFNFRRIATRGIAGVCGAWIHFWPCIWRKNSIYVLGKGNELLKHYSNHDYLVLPRTQGLYRHGCKSVGQYEQKHVIFAPEIKQFHYKNVKKYTNRVQRFGSENLAKAFEEYPVDGDRLKDYDGSHPSILDNHPWRYTEDCRLESPEFNWEEYVDLVTRP